MAHNTQKQKDPRQLPVQLNISIPWEFRERLRDQADRQHISLNQLCVTALRDRYDRNPKGISEAREATREAGATA